MGRPDRKIEPLTASHARPAAELLVRGFAEHWPNAWPTLEDALEEVQDMLDPERVARVALEDGEVVGWAGAIPQYDGNVWELHPLVVGPRLRGLGRALVRDVEAQCRERGGLTMLVGSDDEDEMTSLSGADLFRDPWRAIASIRNYKRHPYEFYQKLGYAIVGVIPDANGPGKPDILLARSLKER